MLSQWNGGRGGIPESPCTTVCARQPAGRRTVVAQLGAAATAPRGNPKGNAEMGPRKRGTPAGAVPTIFARPDTEHLHSQLVVIAGMLPAGAGDPRKESPSSNPCGGMTLTTRSLSLHSRSGTGRRFNGGAGAESRRLSPTPSPAPARRRRPWLRPTTTSVHRSPLHGRELPQAKTTPTRRWRSPQGLTAKSNRQGPRHGAYATPAESNEVGRSHRAAFEVARPSRAPTATPTTTSPG